MAHLHLEDHCCSRRWLGGPQAGQTSAKPCTRALGVNEPVQRSSSWGRNCAAFRGKSTAFPPDSKRQLERHRLKGSSPLSIMRLYQKTAPRMGFARRDPFTYLAPLPVAGSPQVPDLIGFSRARAQMTDIDFQAQCWHRLTDACNSPAPAAYNSELAGWWTRTVQPSPSVAAYCRLTLAGEEPDFVETTEDLQPGHLVHGLAARRSHSGARLEGTGWATNRIVWR